jgi:hypothetical protein
MFYKKNRIAYISLIFILFGKSSYAANDTLPLIDQKEYRSNQACQQAQATFDQAEALYSPGSRYRACASLKNLSVKRFGGEMIDYAGPIKFDSMNNRKNCLKPEKPYCPTCENWKKQQKDIQDFCDNVSEKVKWKLFEALRYISGCDHPAHELRRNRIKKMIETEMVVIETDMTAMSELFKQEASQIKLQSTKCVSK